MPLSVHNFTKSKPPSGSNWNWLTSTFVILHLEISPTEDDVANVFEDKAIEGGKKLVCDEVATEDTFE